MNAIFVIKPFKLYHGRTWTWVFDDPARGLHSEPFVSGIPEILDRWAGEAGAQDAIVCTFGASQFPDAQYILELQKPDCGGAWYQWSYGHRPENILSGWLCPALFKYFSEPPPRIFVGVRSAD